MFLRFFNIIKFFTKNFRHRIAILWFFSLKSDMTPFSKCLVKTSLAEWLVVVGWIWAIADPRGGAVNEWEKNTVSGVRCPGLRSSLPLIPVCSRTSHVTSLSLCPSLQNRGDSNRICLTSVMGYLDSQMKSYHWQYFISCKLLLMLVTLILTTLLGVFLF